MTVVALVSALSLLLQGGSLHGTVMRGPTMPVCRIGLSCTAPAKHVTLFFTRAGVTSRTTTDDRGRYRIRLTAGVYSVKTNQRPYGYIPHPRSVRVQNAVDTQVNFKIETGIR